MNTLAGHGLLARTISFLMVVRVLMLLTWGALSLWRFAEGIRRNNCFVSDRDDGTVSPALPLCRSVILCKNVNI